MPRSGQDPRGRSGRGRTCETSWTPRCRSPSLRAAMLRPGQRQMKPDTHRSHAPSAAQRGLDGSLYAPSAVPLASWKKPVSSFSKVTCMMGLKDKPGITIQNCSSQHVWVLGLRSGCTARVWVLAHADSQELRTKHLRERERERERALLGTISITGWSRARPADRRCLALCGLD